MTDHPKSQKYSQGFPKSISAFSSLSDPRSGNATFHYFGEVLFIALASLIPFQQSEWTYLFFIKRLVQA